jgi:hypothetical protein
MRDLGVELVFERARAPARRAALNPRAADLAPECGVAFIEVIRRWKHESSSPAAMPWLWRSP